MARRKDVREQNADASADSPAELFSVAQEAPADTGETSELAPGDGEQSGNGSGGDGKSGAPQDGSPGPSGEPTEVPADSQAQQQPPQDEVPFFEFGGKKYTRDQLTDDKLRDIEQTVRQFTHIQKLHAEDKSRIEALESELAKYREYLQQQVGPAYGGQQPAQPAQPGQQGQQEQSQQQPQITPQQWLEERGKTVKRLVDEGFLSQDTVDLAPDLAAVTVGIAEAVHNIALRSQAFEQAVIQTYQSQLYPVFSGIAEAAQHESAVRSIRDVDAVLQEIANSGEHFSSLKDPDERVKFISHLADTIDPTLDKITGEAGKQFLAAQYIAYNQAAILDMLARAASKATGAAQPAPNVQAKNLSGETGSPRVGKAGPNDDIVELFSGG